MEGARWGASIIPGLLLTGLLGAAQGEVPSFTARTERVRVQVAVTDKGGRPVTGLRQDQFRIEEDGVPQEILSFQAVGGLEAPEAGATAAPPAADRVFAIVFDTPHLPAPRASIARMALSAFLNERMRPGDRILLTVPGDRMWTGQWPAAEKRLMAAVQELQGAMPEPRMGAWIAPEEAIEIVAHNDEMIIGQVVGRFARAFFGGSSATKWLEEAPEPEWSPGAQGGSIMSRLARGTGGGFALRGMVLADAQQLYATTRQLVHATLASMRAALDILARTRGRKALILVSEGLIYDSSLRDFEDVLEAAREADTAIHFLDASTLGAIYENYPPGMAILMRGLASAGSNALAVDSGGLVVSNVARGLRRIEQESDFYY
jgi:VWFA-related protein